MQKLKQSSIDKHCRNRANMFELCLSYPYEMSTSPRVLISSCSYNDLKSFDQNKYESFDNRKIDLKEIFETSTNVKLHFLFGLVNSQINSICGLKEL